MTVSLGTTDISKLYLGSTEVTKAYLGVTEVYGQAGFTFNSINTFSFNNSYSVAGQAPIPSGLEFNPDGTKMFIVGYSGDKVSEYTLSVGFDLTSTVSFIDSFSISSQDTVPTDIKFNPDGTKMFMLGRGNDRLYSYSLSTGFDISTASYDSLSFRIFEDGNPYGVELNEDGTKMIILGSSNSTLYQYTLSTGWDLNTASYDSVSFAMSGLIGTLLRGIGITPDGTKFLISSVSTDRIYQFSMSTGFDISTASYDSLNLNVSSQDGNPFNTVYNNTGDKLFLIGSSGDSVYEYRV